MSEDAVEELINDAQEWLLASFPEILSKPVGQPIKRGRGTRPVQGYADVQLPLIDFLIDCFIPIILIKAESVATAYHEIIAMREKKNSLKKKKNYKLSTVGNSR